MSDAKILAYYLPQFHPFKENDEWWGKGFTEWTNVGKAKPLFRGHYQPKVPADLGYYDLRLPVVRQQQVELAQKAGIDGFCYWHYWFGGKGRQLMNCIIDDVLESGKPDFPFCLGWANESWKAKLWNKDGKGDKLLMEQRYEGIDDYRAHFEYVLKLFKDHRYVRVDGKPFFLIYRPQLFSEVQLFINLWNKWIKESGVADGIYFVANLDDESEYKKWISMGFDAVTPSMWSRTDPYFNYSKLGKYIMQKRRAHWPSPVRNDYGYICNHLLWKDYMDFNDDVIPFIIPQWDHTPRSGTKGRVFVNVTPELFEQQAKKILQNVQKKNNKIVMLKSWNEWGEGNYMEPDLKYGHGFIDALRNALNTILNK
ncbi:glycoside hydrolase family 99-like domain-containing protein [Fibrobacter sp. UWB13]|uniref:glycosyltransferase WbsX family protein n=1 Tax=Fibrobacter sp. UWB13 TaxID=1896204 RepID=UPI000A0CF5CB|nr:glycoside hydrolase family 99-like domain-containing protein [Fibrobacter sp. UWB13]SMG16785.1 Glycosyltransferase WbsX [Fibrobacter sp. UWB13]